MRLEQEFYRMPRFAEQRERVYTIVDLESLSATALYTGKLPGFKPSYGYNIIPLGNLDVPDLKDVHESFKIDRYGNLYNGHTTFIPKNGTPKHFDH